MTASHVGLTEMQAAFCRFFVDSGGRGAEAARRAGYSPKSASCIAFELRQNPRILARIEALTRGLLGAHAPLAVSTLVSVMQDPEANAMARVRAAEILLDRAGFKPVERYEDVAAPAAMDVGALKVRALQLIDELRRRELGRGEP
jgi:hypothetical protein